jgi:hypothetical protein
MIYCERCQIKTGFGYARKVKGKRLILCYKCAKEVDRENDNSF